MKKFAFVYLPFLFLAYVVTETVLKLNHSSLCQSRGCELAGGLLNIPAIELNYLGIASGFVLFVLGYFSYIRAFSSRYFFIFLSSMVVFETVMIGYQYFASPELCKFCLGVYGSLILIAVLTMKERFFFLLPAIVAPLVALQLLAVPKSDSFVKDDAIYLIQSPTCPHCKKVKEFMDKNSIAYTKLDARDIEARNFIKYLGYKTIPVLVVKKGHSVSLINGDRDILEYFNKDKQKQKAPEKASKNSSESLPTQTSSSVDLLGDVGASSDGCGIELLEEKSCKKEK